MPLKVAIVGRPNVGKSTLFNRLAGKKLAIVNDQPGVTRDRREAEGRIGDLDLELIDTAGFENVSDESLEARMRAQTERAIEDADVCLFVIDGREGVTPLDRIFADLVRRRNRPVILLANKAEGKAADVGAAEAYALGLGEALLISAEHGEGLAELYQELLQFAPEDDEDEGADGDKAIRIAIVGAPQRRQVHLGQPADRRGPAADGAGSRHHPRRHPGGLGVRRPSRAPRRYGGVCAAARGCRRRWRSFPPATAFAPSPSPRL